MEDKKLTFSTQIDAQPAPGMERTIKRYAETMAKANNFDGMVKGLQKVMKTTKEFDKLTRESTLKNLKEKDRLLDQINKKTEKSIKLAGDEARQIRMAERLTGMQRYHAIKSGAVDPEFANSAQSQRYWASRTDASAAAIRARAMGNAFAGGQVLDSMSEEQADAVRAQRQARMMKAGIWLQTAGQAANIVGEMYGLPMKELHNTVASRGVAAQLYNEISSGDYSSLWAMKNGGIERIGQLAQNAKTSAAWSKLGQGLGGVGQMLQGGAVIAGGGAAAGPMAGAAMAYGTSTMLGGARGVAGAITGVMAGDLEAEMASGALQAIDYMKNLDPVKRRQFQEVANRSRMLQEMGMMGGGVGSESWRNMALQGIGGGLTDRETLPLWMQLRHGIGTSGADSLIGTAAGSMHRYGMDRGTATSALIGLSGLSGGAGQAEARLEQILARAFRAGLKDTGVQGALATGMPGLMMSAAGRGSGVSAISGLVAAETARLGGDMGALGVAMGGAGMTGTMFGTNSGVQAMNVAQAGSISRVGAKYGLSRTLQLALITIGDPNKIGSAEPGSQIYDMIAREAGSNTPNVLAEIRGGAYQTTKAFLGPMLDQNPLAAMTVVGGAFGGTGEMAGSAMNIMGSPLGANAPGGFRMGVSGDQEALNMATRGDAYNQVLPVLQALADPKMVPMMANLAKAGSLVSNMLDEMSRIDPDSLGNIPGLLHGVAEGLRDLNIALNSGGGKVWTPRPAAPPAPQAVTSTNAPVRRGAAAAGSVPAGFAGTGSPPMSTQGTH